MTRIEVSFRFDNTDTLPFGMSYMKHTFFEAATNLLASILGVLSDVEVRKQVYKEVSLLELTHIFAELPRNLLLIGRTRIWMVVASTCHSEHYIGTMRKH